MTAGEILFGRSVPVEARIALGVGARINDAVHNRNGIVPSCHSLMGRERCGWYEMLGTMGQWARAARCHATKEVLETVNR